VNITLPYEPQDKQKLLHTTAARQIFYGGAAGGGKSYSLLWDAISFCLDNHGLDAYLFRRTLGELEDNHIRKIQQLIPPVLGKYNDTKKRFEFYNGSGINFCYCEKEKDVLRYQGAEIHWLGIDEAAHLTEYQITYLRTRVRLGSWTPKGKGWLPRIVYASNPGGPGHQFLKTTFIDPSPPLKYFYDESMRDPKNPEDHGWPSIFIPAKMADNLYLDKSYAGQFRALAPELARALTEGDWDAVVGAALHNLSRERHQLRQFSPPRHWTRFMALDWGTARPFSVGWYAVSDGAALAAKDGWPERDLPAGAVIRYAEWYGFDGRPNHGLRLSADQVANGILEREANHRATIVDYYGRITGECPAPAPTARVGDSGMWSSHDGPSPRERMFRVTDGRINLIQSRKDLKVNYAEIIARLAGNSKFSKDGNTSDDPMLFITANCTQFWRTVPPLVLDENDPDKGPDKNQECHVYDELQYALAYRSSVTTKQEYDDMGKPRQRRIDPYATA
jgi:hypothetical protein